MKYKRIDKLDQYYVQANNHIQKQPVTLNFVRDPGLNFRPAKATAGIKIANKMRGDSKK